MALPKIIQKLFSDAGKGTKLNSEIIPPLKDKTSEELFTFIGEKGELTYNTTEKRIVAHDGVTKGGIPMATKKEVEEVHATAQAALPLSGGTMLSKARISFEEDGFIGKYVSEDGNERLLEIGGGDAWNTGAILRLNDNKAPLNPGSFNLCTGNNHQLVGDKDGNLKWIGNPVITSAGGRINNGGAISFDSYVNIQAHGTAGSSVAIDTIIDETNDYKQLRFFDEKGRGAFLELHDAVSGWSPIIHRDIVSDTFYLEQDYEHTITARCSSIRGFVLIQGDIDKRNLIDATDYYDILLNDQFLTNAPLRVYTGKAGNGFDQIVSYATFFIMGDFPAGSRIKFIRAVANVPYSHIHRSIAFINFRGWY